MHHSAPSAPHAIASKMAASWLADLIARRDFTIDELWAGNHWIFGAQWMAERLGHREAHDLLRHIGGRLGDLINLHGDGKSIPAELGELGNECQEGVLWPPPSAPS